MGRSPGWTKLAQPALEILVLAFVAFAMKLAFPHLLEVARPEPKATEPEPAPQPEPAVAHEPVAVASGPAPSPQAAAPQAEPEPQLPSMPHLEWPEMKAAPGEIVIEPSPDAWKLRPREFLTEAGDENANYYRASDDNLELVAGLYTDGRIRVADARGHRFAGALIAGHADLLELQMNEWSEVYLRVTPTGRMQLEFRGGPYDTHVLTCETLHA